MSEILLVWGFIKFIAIVVFKFIVFNIVPIVILIVALAYGFIYLRDLLSNNSWVQKIKIKIMNIQMREYNDSETYFIRKGHFLMEYYNNNKDCWISKTEFIEIMDNSRYNRNGCIFDDIQEVGNVWSKKMLKNNFDSSQVFIIQEKTDHICAFFDRITPTTNLL